MKKFGLVAFVMMMFVVAWFVFSGCASVTKSIYLWDGDKLYVEGESGLIVIVKEGYVKIQSGHAVLKSGEKAIVGQPSSYWEAE